jgi:uncharacterized protein YjbI with pentapeptide repeats
MFSRIFLFLNSIAALTLVASCRPSTGSSSDPKDLEKPTKFVEIDVKDKEVLIYYANETRPNDREKENYDYVVGLMNKSSKAFVKLAASKIEQDPEGFTKAVDEDISEIEIGLCKNNSNKKFSIIVFDNGLSREGKYRYCKPGGDGFKTESSEELKKVYIKISEKKDFRLESSPQATKEMFEAALTLVSATFSPSEYSYSLITKSHGSSKKIMGVRLAVQGNLIKDRENGESEFVTAVEDMAAEKEDAITKVLSYRLEMQGRLTKALESLPEEYPQKESLLKDAILKDGILKDALLKDAILKDTILKDTILKDAILKDNILKDNILKDGILKDSILKDAILKDGLLKDSILKDAILKDGLLASDDASKGILEVVASPEIGIGKREWMEVLASFDSESASKRMEFVSVFAESCESYLGWDIAMDIAESNWKPNIGTLFTSDSRGLNSYRTINYKKFLDSLDLTKSFASQLASHLEQLAEEHKSKNAK